MSPFGLLNLNKPSGITSRRVVDRVARIVKPAKVGHAGTLDPLASGVLVVGVGQATRLVEYVQQMSKRYRATFLLGHTSTTEDIEGDVTELPDAPRPTREELERAATALTGDIEQRPPAYSALKVEGRRAYDLARAGKTVDLAPRTVHVERIELLGYDYPELRIEVECGSGTYVRSLGRDLGEQVGSGAVMSALVRTAIGPFSLEQSLDPDQLTVDNLADLLLPPVRAVEGLMPTCVVSEDQAGRLAHGLSIVLADRPEAQLAALADDGRLIAILERRADGSLAPGKFFPTG